MAGQAATQWSQLCVSGLSAVHNAEGQDPQRKHCDESSNLWKSLRRDDPDSSGTYGLNNDPGIMDRLTNDCSHLIQSLKDSAG